MFSRFFEVVGGGSADGAGNTPRVSGFCLVKLLGHIPRVDCTWVRNGSAREALNFFNGGANVARQVAERAAVLAETSHVRSPDARGKRRASGCRMRGSNDGSPLGERTAQTSAHPVGEGAIGEGAAQKARVRSPKARRKRRASGRRRRGANVARPADQRVAQTYPGTQGLGGVGAGCS